MGVNEMHKNNFDFLRLMFAVFVVITHSYFFSGLGENDLLHQFTKGQTSFSYIGVRGFFIISGYLIFQSMQRSSSLKSYYWKRFLRLFPGLFIALLATACLGFFVYKGNLKEYLVNNEMWTYLPNNLSLYNLQFGIVGVLNGDALNGSLWTIRYEFTFYILVSIIFLFRNRIELVKKLLLLFFVLLLAGKFYLFEKLGSVGFTLSNSMSLNLGLYFIGGSLLASFKIENSNYKMASVIFWIILLCLSFYYHLFSYSQFILLPIVVVLTGISSTKYIHGLTECLGDISYGIYIYSFPVQQAILYYFDFNFIQFLGMSLVLSVFFGILSWNLVEKKALRYKNILPRLKMAIQPS